MIWRVPDRTDAPEWMDRADPPACDMEAALRDLRLVNRWLGGERALLRALGPLLAAPDEPTLRILDVGTGSGDLAAAVVRRARRLGRRVQVVAIDRDRTAVRTAALRHPAAIVRGDACALPFRDGSFDVVVASLFLHHFRLPQVADLLAAFRRLARRAVVINDLRRHRIPWAFIYVAARLTRRHPMFVHDAPLSVLRGFTPAELTGAADAAGAPGVPVRRHWPYRLIAVLPGAGTAS